MRYKKENRVQHTEYDSVKELIDDVVSTITDEDNIEYAANIIANKELTDRLTNYIDNNIVNGFEFDIQSYITRDNVDTYAIEILDDGEVYIEPTVGINGDYHMFDGFMFAESGIDDTIYNVVNKHCDVMVFDLNDF